MERIAEYRGTLLSHVEALYRPGERDLAIDLVKALGCAVTDTGFKGDGTDTFLAVHPNPEDPDSQNNVFYISEVRPEQLALEQHLQRLSEEDRPLSALLESYRAAACAKPFGIPHFALRYRDPGEVKLAEERINVMREGPLAERLHLRVFYPGDADAAVGKSVQGFVYQDVIVSGSFLLGQVIELQAPPSVQSSESAKA